MADKTRKCISCGKDNKYDEYAVNDRLQQSLKEGCTYQEGYKEYAHFS